MMHARFTSNPLVPYSPVYVIEERLSIAEILARVDAPDWFWDFGAVKLNGHFIPRDLWRKVYLKPDAHGVLELTVVPQKKSTLLLIGSIALAIAVTAISAGALAPLLGGAFAAGGLASSLAATGLGLAGSLLLTALSAPPSIKAAESKAQKELPNAGISGNSASILEPLPVVLGSIIYSPPLIAPPYTLFKNGYLILKAIVGVQGQCTIANVKVNGVPADDLGGLSYFTGDGGPASDATSDLDFYVFYTVTEQSDGVELSKIRTRVETGRTDEVDYQDGGSAASSDAEYHLFKTDAAADEIWIRTVFPSGLMQQSDGSAAVMALRIEIRAEGDTTWIVLPTLHCSDNDAGPNPVRTEIRLIFGAPANGIHYAEYSEYPIFLANYETATGQSFVYTANSYFQENATGGVLPTMTAATTSGVTMSAETEFGAGNEAWKAADGSNLTYWRPQNNTLSSYLQFDLGSAQTIKSFFVTGDPSNGNATYCPMELLVYGSNDPAFPVLTSLCHIELETVMEQIYGQISPPAAYRYYRIQFNTNNGAANEELRIYTCQLYTDDTNGSSHSGNGVSYANLASHVKLGPHHAEIYLDTATFPKDVYEVRIKRSIAFSKASFVGHSTYTYGGSAANARFFEYFSSGGVQVVAVDQVGFIANCNIEKFSTVVYTHPIDDAGIAYIGISWRNGNAQSISATFSSLASTFDGTIWSEAKTATSNPAALYREILLGHANADPLPGEIIDEVELGEWYTRCAAAGHECNVVLQGRTVADALQILASCGYASPRTSNLWGIVEDYDTSADPITQVISPLNSRDLGTTLAIPRLPHAIRAEYSNGASNFEYADTTVYRDGYTAANATLVETISYPGFTNTAKVQARARFDIRQGQFRTRMYERELGIEGNSFRRDQLVGLADDVLDRQQCYGLISSVTTSGGNVTAITLHNIMPFSSGDGDVRAVDDITTLTDILDPGQLMGVAIRLDDGTVLSKQITEVTDSNVCTFSTPFADTGVVVPGLMVVGGVFGREFRRCKVIAINPNGADVVQVTLVDEAPEIFD